MSQLPDPSVAFLRHTLAVLAYRAEKVLRDPPPALPSFALGPRTRTPAQIVGHLGDLLEWAHAMAAGDGSWRAASVGTWDADVARFWAAMARLDAWLASGAAPCKSPNLIFQGPISDALTHVGQIALLRGHLGAPVRPESYARALIVAGRVGPQQPAERREFDGDASARD